MHFAWTIFDATGPRKCRSSQGWECDNTRCAHCPLASHTVPRLKDLLPPLAQWAGLCLLLLTAGAARGQSLLELYQASRQHDAAYLAARAEVDASQARTGQARAPLLPQLRLQGDVTRTTTDTSMLDLAFGDGSFNMAQVPGLTSGRSSFNSRSVSLAGVQALYHPADRIVLDQSKEAARAADIALVEAEQDLVVRVARAYFDVLAAQNALDSVQALKQAIARQRQLAQRNFEIGNATITDSREAQARMDQATAQEIAVQNDLHVKQLALQELVGRMGARPLPRATPVQLPVLAPPGVSQWQELARANNAQIQQQSTALNIAEMDTRKARAGHLPTVDLQVSAGTTHYSGNPGLAAALGGNKNASIGVQLTLPLFSGLATQYRVRETLAAQDKARANLSGSEREVTQAVQAAFFGVQSGLAQVQALETALDSARSALQANQRGYEVGVRVNIDVLNAQAQVHDAEDQLAQARYNVLIGLLQLKQAAGTLTEVDLAQINALLEGVVRAQ